MIKGVKFVTVPVRDQAAAIAFWTEKVGFQVMTDQPMNETERWVELGIAAHGTKVVPFPMDDAVFRIGNYMNITFYSDDVEGTYRELSARGVEFLSPPKKADWGTSVQFKDQDGTTFLLSSK
jgi:predicted enzyme related to lactoylglutathione lyase